MFGLLEIILGGCVIRETYDDVSAGKAEYAVVSGYWRYRILYDEELHIVSVDGRRESGKTGWPYAYSVSIPAGRHWLELAIMRNSSEISRCAIEWKFERQYHYKMQHLNHKQFLLAHPSVSPFPASVSIVVTTPLNSVHQTDVPAMCGWSAICRQDADCLNAQSCEPNRFFSFGFCTVKDAAGGNVN